MIGWLVFDGYCGNDLVVSRFNWRRMDQGSPTGGWLLD